MKDNYINIKDAVKCLKENYNFRGLLHFTDFSNLNSIINIGYLLSRSLCYAYSIDFYDVLSNKPMRCNDYVKFYFEEKNHKALQNLKIPVYLLFSKDLLGLELSMLSNGLDEAAEISKCLNFNLNKQTEFLVAEPVPLKYLKNIIFRCEADYKRACNLFGKNKLYSVEPSMFNHEDNYIKDYSIYSDFEKQLFVIHFSTNLPVKNNDYNKYKLYDLNDNLIKETKIRFLESKSTHFNLEVNKPTKEPINFKLYLYGTTYIEETIE